MALLCLPFLCLADNYGVLLRDERSEATAVIDAPEAKPILDRLDRHGWRLTDIFITHHHADHVQGIRALKQVFPKARVIGPAREAAMIGPLDLALGDGDKATLGTREAIAIETPGHTIGHLCYHFAQDDWLFAGDTLFAMGCGRVFETAPEVMHASLEKLKRLPDQVQIHCGHEYTLANARFAATVDPDNPAVRARLAQAEAMRAEGEMTLPTTMGLERIANPFLRADDPAIQARLGMAGASPAAVFAELRARKNAF